MNKYYRSFVLVCVFLGACISGPVPVQLIAISRISIMPDQPEPFKMLDWYEKAHNFDQYAFNTELKGEFMPFLWVDSSKRNLPQKTFGMYTVIGDVRQGIKGS